MLDSFSPVSLKFTSLKEMESLFSLFIQQHQPKVLMGWWHTPQHLLQLTEGLQWLESTFVFLEQRAKFNLYMSVLAEMYPGCVTPVSQGHWDCALLPCSIPAPLTAPLLPWAQMCSFSSRCIAALGKSLIGADADFCFSGQNARNVEPWTDRSKCSLPFPHLQLMALQASAQLPRARGSTS